MSYTNDIINYKCINNYHYYHYHYHIIIIKQLIVAHNDQGSDCQE